MVRRLVVLAAVAGLVTALHAQTDAAAAIDQRIRDADAALAEGRFDAMAAAAEAAVALSRPSGDRARLARSLYALGQARFYQSRNEEARAAHEEALAMATEIGDAPLRAAALNGIGLALRELGDYDQALDYLQRALQAHRAAANRPEQARVERNIAVLYWQLGDLSRAEATVRGAVDLARAIGDRTLEAITLQAYGVIVGDAGRPREALALHRRSLEIAGTLNAPALLIEPHVGIGDALDALGDHDGALESYRTLLRLSERASYAVGEAVAMAHLGETYRELGRGDEALDWLLRARALFATLGPDAHVANVLANEFHIARARRDAGQADEALATYRGAIALLERMRRAAVPIEAATGSVNAARSALFVDTAALLAERQEPAGAFAVAEQYHARAFLDSFAASRVDAERTLSAEERARTRQLVAQAARVQAELWTGELPRERRRRLEAELGAIDDESERIAGGVRRRSPSYAVHYPALLDAKGARDAVLRQGDVLVEYMLGDPASLAIAISPTDVHAMTLPGRSSLTPLVDAYRAAVSTRVSPLTRTRAAREVRRAAAAVSRAVVAPIEPFLAGASRVIIVADGPLAYVPFEPLDDLGDRFAVSYAPSASALHAIEAADRTGQPTRDLLAIGDPVPGPAPAGTPLPFSLAEVQAIGALFPAARRRLLLAADATEGRVKETPLADYRLLHFATHGRLDPTNPGRSGLVLSRAGRERDDGVLQAREIMQLRLRADLVTLSACETGLGRVISGEGVLGLPRAFFYAGARSVVVSLWDVNDAATAELMRAFYTRVRRGEDRARALGEAKRALAHGSNPLWRAPYFWAPFVFVGSSR